MRKIYIAYNLEDKGDKSMATKLILFDLLTALMDSWTIWEEAAGNREDGLKWRYQYLKTTYGCGAYRSYETLVEEAAVAAGFEKSLAEELKKRWNTLSGWPEALGVLQELKKNYRLGVVTNCSEKLGRQAASQMGIEFDVIVTAAQAGFYKPDPRPYELALSLAETAPSEALFVAGSAYDMLGTSKVGMPTIWHNRIGMKMPEGIPSPMVVIKTLNELPKAISDYENGIVHI